MGVLLYKDEQQLPGSGLLHLVPAGEPVAARHWTLYQPCRSSSAP